MRSKRLLHAALSVAAASVPLILFGYGSMTPPIGHTGAPTEDNCTACHVGSPAIRNSAQLALTFSNGNTYTPGERKTVTFRNSDEAVRYGFLATVRRASNPETESAGRLIASQGTNVVCSDGAACAALQYVGHVRAQNSNTFNFEWEAPASDVGEVVFYVASNAANGSFDPTGDQIHLREFRLAPAQSQPGERPAINESGVVNGASFAPGLVAGSWASIFGTNLAPSQKFWHGLISSEGVFPTEIDGVEVKVQGVKAALYFISPNQINFQVPDVNLTGPVSVEVSTRAGSTERPAQVQAISPAFFMFDPDNRKYVAATHPNTNGVAVGRAGLFAGRESRPARPGDVIEMWGTGFGPTNPARPAGRVIESAPLANEVRVRIGGVEVTPQFAGLTGAGLYQINVPVPELPAGDHAVVATVNGVETQAGAFLTVGAQ